MLKKIKCFFWEIVPENRRMQHHHGCAEVFYVYGNSMLSIIFPLHIVYRAVKGTWFFLTHPAELPFERQCPNCQLLNRKANRERDRGI